GSETEPILITRGFIADHLQIAMVIEQRVSIVQFAISVEVSKLNISGTKKETGAILQEGLVDRLFSVGAWLQFIGFTTGILGTLRLGKGNLYGIAIRVQFEIVFLVKPIRTVAP